MNAHDISFRSDRILKEIQVLNSLQLIELASLSDAIIRVLVSKRCNFGSTGL